MGIVTTEEKKQWLINHGELSYMVADNDGLNTIQSIKNGYQKCNWRSNRRTCGFMVDGNGREEVISKMYRLIQAELYKLINNEK